MTRLISFLPTGCWHEWEYVTIPLNRPEGIVIDRAGYCKKCGNWKKKKKKKKKDLV